MDHVLKFDAHKFGPSQGVNAFYLQSQLSYDQNIRAQIRATVNSGGRDVANSETLNRLLFAWPQPEEQLRMLQRIEALESTRQSEIENQKNLEKCKLGLMHDLLTGRVRVNIGQSVQANA